LYALSRAGVHGRKYARPFDRRLRKIISADGHSLGEHASADALFRSDSNPNYGVVDTPGREGCDLPGMVVSLVTMSFETNYRETGLA
jgi:hypothetical protein